MGSSVDAEDAQQEREASRALVQLSGTRHFRRMLPELEDVLELVYGAVHILCQLPSSPSTLLDRFWDAWERPASDNRLERPQQRSPSREVHPDVVARSIFGAEPRCLLQPGSCRFKGIIFVHASSAVEQLNIANFDDFVNENTIKGV
ncbi:MAG: hypothetical protein O3B64_03605 [bacterium]|nr:hypothetical protein [bacterium]